MGEFNIPVSDNTAHLVTAYKVLKTIDIPQLSDEVGDALRSLGLIIQVLVLDDIDRR